MSWYEKEQQTPFDEKPITGLSFLFGDVVARRYGQDWIHGKKYPLITFPSGTDRTVSLDRETEHIHLFSSISLSRSQSYPESVHQLRLDGQELGLRVFDDDRGTVVVTQPDSNRGYGIRFDTSSHELINIVPLPQDAMELLPGHLRAILPPLYSQEKVGLKAVSPIKFFTPDANWTWYPTEFDGTDLFFGLVSGFEVELGYFSLSELESIAGPLHLPIERDLYFEPTTLAELQTRHARRRYE